MNSNGRFKKGDRVEWNSKGTIMYGVVDSVRKDKMRAVHDGGKFQTAGPSQIFRHSEKPVKTDTIKTPLDIYAVVKFKAMPVREGIWEGHEGNGLDARITKNGKEIIGVHNSGSGGPNDYFTLKGIPASELDQFMNDIKEWFRLMTGSTDANMADELWVFWFAEYRIYGITAEEYLKDTVK